MLKSLRLSPHEQRVALIGFLAKVALFWIAELLICQLDGERSICRLVSRGFVPCLISFAVMDALVLPHLRRRLDKQRTSR